MSSDTACCCLSISHSLFFYFHYLDEKSVSVELMTHACVKVHFSVWLTVWRENGVTLFKNCRIELDCATQRDTATTSSSPFTFRTQKLLFMPIQQEIQSVTSVNLMFKDLSLRLTIHPNPSSPFSPLLPLAASMSTHLHTRDRSLRCSIFTWRSLFIPLFLYAIGV